MKLIVQFKGASNRFKGVILELINLQTRRALGRAHTSVMQFLIHENISGPIHFRNIMLYIIYGPMPGVGLVVRVAGLGSLGPEFESHWPLN